MEHDPGVAVDVTPLVGVRTGIGQAVAEIVAALGALDQGPELVPYALSLRARAHRDELPAGTRFVPLPARLLLRRWARTDRPRVDRWLRPAAVLHATNYLAPPSALPTVVSVYDCSFVRFPELCSPEVRALEPVLRRAIARGATVHTGSSFVADEVEECFGPGLLAAGRVEVVPLGVPPLGPPVAPGADVRALLDEAPYVLALGTLEPRKNHPGLVEAFGRAARRDPRLRLVLAGPPGAARADVEAARARLPESTRARVLVLGAVDDAARRALLEHARLLAYPSIYEGFGFPVLEAMTVGTPVVAAATGSIPEVAGDAAVLVDPCDPDALADALVAVAGDDARREVLVARGRERAAAFSWEATADGLAALYRRLAA